MLMSTCEGHRCRERARGVTHTPPHPTQQQPSSHTLSSYTSTTGWVPSRKAVVRRCASAAPAALRFACHSSTAVRSSSPVQAGSEDGTTLIQGGGAVQSMQIPERARRKASRSAHATAAGSTHGWQHSGQRTAAGSTHMPLRLAALTHPCWHLPLRQRAPLSPRR